VATLRFCKLMEHNSATHREPVAPAEMSVRADRESRPRAGVDLQEMGGTIVSTQWKPYGWFGDSDIGFYVVAHNSSSDEYVVGLTKEVGPKPLLEVNCTHCGAAEGRPCRSGGHVRNYWSHSARYWDARCTSDGPRYRGDRSSDWDLTSRHIPKLSRLGTFQHPSDAMAFASMSFLRASERARSEKHSSQLKERAQLAERKAAKAEEEARQTKERAASNF